MKTKLIAAALTLLFVAGVMVSQHPHVSYWSHVWSHSAPSSSMQPGRPQTAGNAPVATCISGLQQQAPDYAVVQTPDCRDPRNPIGTEQYVAWLEKHKSEIGGAYIAIFTFTDPDIKAEYLAYRQAGIPVYLALDYSQLQAVGASADKKAAEALQHPQQNGTTTVKKRRRRAPKQSEHMIAGDLCQAGVQVVWGTAPGESGIMHLKLTVLVDKRGVPRWMEDGSFNYTRAANFESNTLGFDDDPKDAATAFNQWLLVHDAMVQANKPFYSKDLGLPTACPPLSEVPLAARH